MTTADIAAQAPELSFPFETPPGYGEVVEVVPGIRWLRIPLPFRLDHVNIYLIEDDEGWAIFDTGIGTDAAREVWEGLFAGPLSGLKVSRIIVSHFHPDHIGLAGWLCERFDAPLLTSYSTYCACRMMSLDPQTSASTLSRAFYLRHGMSEEAAEITSTSGLRYLRQVGELPPTFLRLLMGDALSLGGRRFRVLSADGHAPEQLMLHCPEEGLLLAADQVLEKITPNIGVWAMAPNDDPLGHYMRALRLMEAELPHDVLVLPGHRRPFRGLALRCRQILEHHEERCGIILEACAKRPLSAGELMPAVFHNRTLTAHETSFAFSETMAHVNRLIRRGDLEWIERDGDLLCRTIEGASPAA